MRRDFSIVLAEHGLDLDQALHDANSQPDYSIADHARDLAGALRWNAVSAMRRMRSSPA
jgi:asparagine synthase (glutamine-hydrolysing)